MVEVEATLLRSRQLNLSSMMAATRRAASRWAPFGPASGKAMVAQNILIQSHPSRSSKPQYDFLASKALFKVTESAKSTEPPLGNPNPMRVTRSPLDES